MCRPNGACAFRTGRRTGVQGDRVLALVPAQAPHRRKQRARHGLAPKGGVHGPAPAIRGHPIRKTPARLRARPECLAPGPKGPGARTGTAPAFPKPRTRLPGSQPRFFCLMSSPRRARSSSTDDSSSMNAASPSCATAIGLLARRRPNIGRLPSTNPTQRERQPPGWRCIRARRASNWAAPCVPYDICYCIVAFLFLVIVALAGPGIEPLLVRLRSWS